MAAHKPVKPIQDVMENAKSMKAVSLNRTAFLSKLDDDTYALYLRSVYSGPHISRTKRRVSESTMIALVRMFMELNGLAALKIENGQLMCAEKSGKD